MSFLSRLLGKHSDERKALSPLWQRVIELARAKAWYARLGVADSMEGRFDMVSLVLAAVLLRMEREPALAEAQARLTELFVDDMEGQLRQSGIGDPTVGKHVRKHLVPRRLASQTALGWSGDPLAQSPLLRAARQAQLTA